MNNDQLEYYLKKLSACPSEQAVFDERIEERMNKEFRLMKSNRKSRNRLAIALLFFLMCGTGFVVMGGENNFLNYLSSTSQFDEEGNAIQATDSWWISMLRHVHQHFHDFHGSAGKGSDAK